MKCLCWLLECYLPKYCMCDRSKWSSKLFWFCFLPDKIHVTVPIRTKHVLKQEKYRFVLLSMCHSLQFTLPGWLSTKLLLTLQGHLLPKPKNGIWLQRRHLKTKLYNTLFCLKFRGHSFRGSQMHNTPRKRRPVLSIWKLLARGTFSCLQIRSLHGTHFCKFCSYPRTKSKKLSSYIF